MVSRAALCMIGTTGQMPSAPQHVLEPSHSNPQRVFAPNPRIQVLVAPHLTPESWCQALYMGKPPAHHKPTPRKGFPLGTASLQKGNKKVSAQHSSRNTPHPRLQRSSSPLLSYLKLRAAARWHLWQEQHLASISGFQELPYPNTTHSKEAETPLYVGLTNAQPGLPQGKGDLTALECTPAMENGELIPAEERCTN